MNHETRLAILEALIRDKYEGSDAKLAAAGGPSMSMVSQWRSGVRKLGERAARKTELKLRLPLNYLEGSSANISDRAQKIAKIFDALSDSDKNRLEPLILAALGPAVSDEQVEEKMQITKTETSGRKRRP